MRTAALALARACGADNDHTMQVTRLALRLFDELQSLHGLRADARHWLECGALLHDIGWCTGRRGHHRTALRLILESPLLPDDARGRLLVGNIARYHRKAPPSLEHPEFAALAPGDREVVRVVAGLLRVADALDYTHQQLVRDLLCRLGKRAVRIHCLTRADLTDDAERAAVKGTLLRDLLRREIKVTWEIE